MHFTSELEQRSTGAGGRRLTRPLAVFALVGALVAGTTSAAEAQSISNTDAAGDVANVDYDTGATTPAPDQSRSDVLGSRMRHGAYRVSIRVQYAELEPIPDGGNLLYIRMVTNEGVRRILTLETEPGDSGGYTTFTRGDEQPVRCAVRHSIDYTGNAMTVSFPRRCASRPRWVRFRVAAARFDEELHIDDALRDRPMTDEDNFHFAQSRRVYRTAAR
jgi:hypothetical protein